MGDESDADWQEGLVDWGIETALKLCSDCPPEDYPNDKTRCATCPRRAVPEGVAQSMSEIMDGLIEKTIFGGGRGGGKQQRQTALRARGNGFEMVELDDAGKIIEPIRCTCGAIVVLMHRKGCPMEYFTGA